tara:strand:- start:199 stop:405 length:207 start_codon:yes stop_codon:yes gene_type:complete
MKTTNPIKLQLSYDLALRVSQFYSEYISEDKFQDKKLENIAIDFYVNLMPQIQNDFFQTFKNYNIQKL